MLIGIFLSCKAPQSEAIKVISTSDAVKLIKTEKELVIVDVRTPSEWAMGAIDNSIQINVKENDFASKIDKLEKDAPTLVYCKKGGRSAKATSIMEELGFTNLYDLKGGYDGYSVEN